MLNKLYRDWVNVVSRSDPAFILPISVTALAIFLPTLLILLIEWRFRTFDLFPGSDLLLPWSIAIALVLVAFSSVLTFYGLRNSAYPGSLLYRLTHSTPRRRR
jgi:hypothetical protein